MLCPELTSLLAKTWAVTPTGPTPDLGGPVEAYQSGLDRPLDDSERAAIPAAMARQPLWSISVWVALLNDEAAARRRLAGTGAALAWAPVWQSGDVPEEPAGPGPGSPAAAECGIGSLLMPGAGLPRDEFGWPYQALFTFEGGRTTGLVYDAEGHVLAYRNTPEGDPLVEEPTWQRAPEAIAAAAVEWWEEERRT